MQPHKISSSAKLEIILRSAVFFTGMILSTFVISPCMIAARPFAFRVRWALANRWVRFNLWMLKTVCRLDFQVQGRENIPAQPGVILCKHQSAWETIALQVIFPPLVFILKQELLRLPVWGWAMATLKPIAINRAHKTAALKQVLNDGVKRLREGLWVVVFPEGTRVAPGKKGHYGASGAMLAHRAGCPVVPVAHNAGEYWSRRAFLKYPGTIQVRIGPPIDATKFDAAEITAQAERWIEAQMQEISRAS
ncbi:lysophospholipid acyltransferase family protein [Methylococcus geothermalis]|uniref:1-acyl-sn-glycerol-3-phosphate acyltransferase n=1 Tax=Methylococcus geothermalis TaxID=2681310 RepID=A0A858Q788_9GAMM|nr:lysophospholipid acyltransferase family protein [Methylococcus geothermalis]QJD29718.1 1-acyl-sn-glycerol-3-phosphate acyltransferase [Methylococcus geothermalis]